MQIMICTDGSERALEAVRFGGEIAARLQAKVTLLSVETQADQKDWMAEEMALLKQMGLAPNLLERSGSSAQEIPLQIDQMDYDLVVAGFAKQSFLKELLRGATSLHIVQATQAPVLIVRDPPQELKHVLIGISGSGLTQACATLGGRIAAAFGAHVTLLYVASTPTLMYAGLDQIQEPLEALLQADTKEARAIKQAATILADMDVETDIQLVHGLAERELLHTLREGEYDLLIIGATHTGESFRRWMMPSITDRLLLHTRRPVLVVRPFSQGESRRGENL